MTYFPHKVVLLHGRRCNRCSQACRPAAPSSPPRHCVVSRACPSRASIHTPLLGRHTVGEGSTSAPASLLSFRQFRPDTLHAAAPAHQTCMKSGQGIVRFVCCNRGCQGRSSTGLHPLDEIGPDSLLKCIISAALVAPIVLLWAPFPCSSTCSHVAALPALPAAAACLPLLHQHPMV